jgi:outer membrane protein TolC
VTQNNTNQSAIVDQTGGYAGSSDIEQTGDENSARVEQSDTEIAAIRQAFLNDRRAKLMARDQLLRETDLTGREVQTRQALLDDERQRFNAGLGLLGNLLQAEQELLESRIRAADALGRLETARLALLLADGTLLSAYGIDTPLPSLP